VTLRLSSNLARALTRLDWTAEDVEIATSRVADPRIGRVDASGVRRILTETVWNPRLLTVVALADALGMSVDELIGRKVPKGPVELPDRINRRRS